MYGNVGSFMRLFDSYPYIVGSIAAILTVGVLTFLYFENKSEKKESEEHDR